MKAMLYRESGGPEVLQYTDFPDPEPGPADVVVRVEATALNHLDVLQRQGYWYMDGFTFPNIAGMDLAGEVVTCGAEVTGVSVGDRVVVDPSMAGAPAGSAYAGLDDLYGELGIIGGTLPGGYAEQCLVPGTHVHRVPDGMSIDHAATFPTCYLTASHALFATGDLGAGETVMIHAAGSGVSSAGIQLAKRAGATVIATAGTDAKCERALELGADHAVNNRTGDVTAFAREVTGGRGVDMVFDHVGPALWAQSMFALAIRGRLVNCGGTTGDEVTIPSLGYMYHHGIRILGSDPYGYEEFAPAWQEFCDGDFEVVIDSEFPLADAAAAQQKLIDGDFFGKILLKP